MAMMVTASHCQCYHSQRSLSIERRDKAEARLNCDILLPIVQLVTRFTCTLYSCNLENTWNIVAERMDGFAALPVQQQWLRVSIRHNYGDNGQ